MGKAKSELVRSMGCGLVFAGCLGCLCFSAVSLATAESTPLPQEHKETSRPLTAREGRAITSAARENEQQVRGKPDCSHLVHQIYLLAGFEYPYASSFDLYAGAENFTRVKTPQPGDLIVWPGHVGIVLDPARHTFYSSVRSGKRIEFYDGPYWRARGKPRFYRYVVESPGKLVAVKAQKPSRASATVAEHTAGPVIAEDSDAPPIASKQPGKEETEGPAEGVVRSSAAVPAATTETPASILISAGQGKPTREEAAEGISEISNAAGNALRADDPLNPHLPVVIIDQLNVERVETKRDRGWVQVRIDSTIAIAGGRANLKPRHEKIRWELRRTDSGWEALMPADRAYVPRDVAVRTLAARLARLTQTEAGANHEDRVVREEASLARLLNTLLQNK